MSSIGNVANDRFDHVMKVNICAPMYAMRKAVQVSQARKRWIRRKHADVGKLL